MLFINKVPGDKVAFEKKVKDITYKLGILPSWLMFPINFESAGTFRASIENSFGCTGLIQFCSDSGQSSWKYEDKYKTINGKRYYLKDLKAMTNVEQLDVVYEYLSNFKGKMKTFYDVYLAILWPAALGKNDDYVINTATNPIFDLNKNGTITVSEVKEFLNGQVEKLVPVEYKSDFLKKNTSGSVEPIERNAAQIYQRELIIIGVIIILLIILWYLYKKL